MFVVCLAEFPEVDEYIIGKCPEGTVSSGSLNPHAGLQVSFDRLYTISLAS